MLKEHEKFIAFCLLGFSLVGLAVLIYLHPLADSAQNAGTLQIINMIVGALIGAFGGAASKFFDTKTNVTVDNTKSNPVPTEEGG